MAPCDFFLFDRVKKPLLRGNEKIEDLIFLRTPHIFSLNIFSLIFKYLILNYQISCIDTIRNQLGFWDALINKVKFIIIVRFSLPSQVNSSSERKHVRPRACFTMLIKVIITKYCMVVMAASFGYPMSLHVIDVPLGRPFSDFEPQCHVFRTKQLRKPRPCHLCHQAVIKQASCCRVCKYICHKTCEDKYSYVTLAHEEKSRMYPYARLQHALVSGLTLVSVDGRMNVAGHGEERASDTRGACRVQAEEHDFLRIKFVITISSRVIHARLFVQVVSYLTRHE
ncbi:hypothetical protein ALC60_07967 [Trachymyrmex zeteki]|uniref:Phorbol-ester/DAG-type domain-containing protein n=1 Tax=Mycetomoellerius zeteki TaxID=64791 RepID=A0A151WYD5_9HYME|nr:hypothetical protein ALC60_07967 [Trachymyrmex zeteki]